MHCHLTRWAVLAATALASTACVEGPLAPAVASYDSISAAAAGRHLGQLPLPCVVLRKNSTDAGWSNRSTAIYYPLAEIAAGNRTVQYRFRGTSHSGEVVFAAYCTVPYTAAALRRADRRFQVVHGGGADQFAARAELIMTQGCVWDGMCVLDPIVVIAPPPDEDEDDDGGDSGGGGGGGAGGGQGGDGTCAESYPQLVVEDPDCGSPEYPTEEEEADARSCPQRLVGKVITALIPVAGRNHEFSFEGAVGRPMVRTGAARSPATFEISGPTVSRDAWWIAERGTVKVNCTGGYSPSAFGYRLWIGVASYAGDSDLHMVMGPGHPEF